MKKLAIILFAICAISSSSIAQTSSNNTVRPILMNKSVLSGVGLQKIDLKNEPEKDFYQKRLFRGEEISVYVVSTESWTNVLPDYAFDEYVYLLNGQSAVKPSGGASKTFNSGQHLFMPRGFEGEWEIKAGKNLHYELSVITTYRADSNKVVKKLPAVDISPSTLSGIQIHFEENGLYREVIHSGVELEILLEAEKPRTHALHTSEERLINILSGQLILTDKDNIEHSFYTGDFLVLPNDFEGNWKSEGHGLVKYLVVRMSK